MDRKRELSILKKIARDIKEIGGDMYYVGGYVRDKILGKENKDIDVEIHNVSVKDVKHILKKYGNVDEIGANFGVLRLKGLDIDFTFPRTESKTGNKHTDFEINVNPFLGVELASKRRDFTMNSIMQNVISGEYIDIYGGISDIKNKTIRYVDKNTFIEDALRPLRACQFASRLGFSIDRDVIEVSKTMDYTQLSNERIIMELDKALKSDKPSIAFNYLLEMGILNQLIPELTRLKGCEQNKEHHPEGDVWNHTMLVLDMGAKLKNKTNNPRFFMYACLLHDIGKPDTTMLDDKGVIRSINHENVGAELSKVILDRLTTEKEIKTYVYKLTKYHMVAHKLLELKDLKIKRIMLDVDINDLLILNTCDISGREASESSLKRLSKIKSKFEKVEELSNGSFGKIEPYIQGRDLIKLGLKPSAEFGKLLNLTYELQLQGKSKDELLSILKNKIHPKENNSLKILETYYLNKIELKEYKTNKYNKREKLFNRFHSLLLMEEYSKIKVLKTLENKIPYISAISKNKNSVNKLFFFPDMCIISDLRLDNLEILFDNYNNTLNERFETLDKIFLSTKLSKNQCNLLKKTYSNLK